MSTYTQSDLMDLLVASVGLPTADRTDDAAATLPDVGLDSLAFLQLCTEVQQRYGVDLEADGRRFDEIPFGEMVSSIDAATGSAVDSAVDSAATAGLKASA